MDETIDRDGGTIFIIGCFPARNKGKMKTFPAHTPRIKLLKCNSCTHKRILTLCNPESVFHLRIITAAWDSEGL